MLELGLIEVLSFHLAFHDPIWTPTVGLDFNILSILVISILKCASRRKSVLCNSSNLTDSPQVASVSWRLRVPQLSLSYLVSFIQTQTL